MKRFTFTTELLNYSKHNTQHSKTQNLTFIIIITKIVLIIITRKIIIIITTIRVKELK